MGCRCVNSLSNSSILFGVGACTFNLLYAYKIIGFFSLFFQSGIANFSGFSKGEGKKMGCR